MLAFLLTLLLHPVLDLHIHRTLKRETEYWQTMRVTWIYLEGVMSTVHQSSAAQNCLFGIKASLHQKSFALHHWAFLDPFTFLLLSPSPSTSANPGSTHCWLCTIKLFMEILDYVFLFLITTISAFLFFLPWWCSCLLYTSPSPRDCS